MKTIPTAQEFINRGLDDSGFELTGHQLNIIARNVREFAKLHVEAALKEKVIAMKKQREEDSSYDMNELDAFTYDAYPLNLIK